MKLIKRNKKVCGVGVNDADYNVFECGVVDGKAVILWRCPFYAAWTGMLNRCYGEKLQTKYPTYKGCSVVDEWFNFMTFKAWMEKQDWEGKQLDKDLLVVGNKVYSPDTCVFVSDTVNKFMTDSNATRGEYMLGVYWKKANGKFLAQCRDPFENKQKHLGLFTDELEAHLAWKSYKHKMACQLAELETDPRIIEALTTRYL